VQIRKRYDVEDGYPIYEVLGDESECLFSVSISDNGFEQIAFHRGIAGQTMLILDFLEWLEQVRTDAISLRE